jgi:predicted ATPase
VVIEKIRVSNFKSFDDFEIPLDQYTVLVGANASGKSNFMSVLKFLRDISVFNLRDAVSLQGSVKYLRNISIGASRDLSIEVVLRPDLQPVPIARKKKGVFVGARPTEITYAFALRFNKRGVGFQVAEDHLSAKLSFAELRSGRRNFQEAEGLGHGEVSVKRVGNQLEYHADLSADKVVKQEDIIPQYAREQRLPPDQLICERGFLFYFITPGALFTDIAVYDLDPKLPKKAVQITGRANLEEDGGNLALALRDVLEGPGSRKKFTNLLHDILPFVHEAGVQRLADKSVLFTVCERYFRKEDLPGSLVSDGTVGIAALIVALYFEGKSITALEEPERNIHPYLISKVVDMMKDASRNKQVLITTHNPQIVKHSGAENVLLVSRNDAGFSKITKPANSDEIQEFLRNEVGIDELFAQNLLEV